MRADEENREKRIYKFLTILTLWNTFLSIFLLIVVFFVYTQKGFSTIPYGPYDNSNINIGDVYCKTFEKLCRIGDSIVISTSGISMEPTLHSGASYECKRAAAYGLNDIITFYKSGSIITHRIIGISDNRYITKGDNSELYKDATQDPWLVYSNEILCKITKGFKK